MSFFNWFTNPTLPSDASHAAPVIPAVNQTVTILPVIEQSNASQTATILPVVEQSDASPKATIPPSTDPSENMPVDKINLTITSSHVATVAPTVDPAANFSDTIDIGAIITPIASQAATFIYKPNQLKSENKNETPTDHKIQDHRQKYLSVLKQVKGIEIQAIPLYKSLNVTGEVEIPVLFNVLVGDYSAVIKRNPIHICLVLDRSGSMGGNPLNYCKKAIKHVMTQLEETDHVSLVAYDDQVDTIFEREACEFKNFNRLSELIDNVTDRGYTNISGGLTRAAEILNKESKDSVHQKIVFLFSDGVANRGLTNIDALGALMSQWVDNDKIRFSSFGIGTEYNEKWMRSIARGGEGNYFFIDNVKNIPDIVEKGLMGFTKVIGNHVNFAVKGLNGHSVVSLQNDTTPETLLNGRNLPYLRSLGLYQFLAKIKVEGIPTVTQEVCECFLTFQPIAGLESLSPQKASVAIDFVANVNHIREANLEVLCYLMINECAELNHKVDEAVKRFEAQEAITLKKQIIEKYESVLPYDRFGVIGALLENEKYTLLVLQREGLSSRSCKTQENNSSMGYCQTSTDTKSKWETKKAVKTAADADLGYTLF